MYDPNAGSLNKEDQSFLEALHAKFLNSRLAKVGANSLRGHLIGKILRFAEEQGRSWKDVVVGALPVEITTARQVAGLTPADEAAIEYSRDQSATYITDMADRTKREIRAEITQALEQGQPPQELSRALFHRFSEANADWRRIALTETAVAVSNGYLTGLPAETVVVGDSSMDACAWCLLNINQRAFKVVPEPPPMADGLYFLQEDSWGYVWPGKTNIGRSKYPKRANGTQRGPDELWHPCIPAHPHCRCRWRRLISSVEEIQAGTNLVVQKTKLGL